MVLLLEWKMNRNKQNQIEHKLTNSLSHLKEHVQSYLALSICRVNKCQISSQGIVDMIVIYIKKKGGTSFHGWEIINS